MGTLQHRTLGEIAYSAWRERCLVYAPHLAPWNGLPVSAQDAWEEIGQSVVDAFKAQNGSYNPRFK